jgi:hypothetical protein
MVFQVNTAGSPSQGALNESRQGESQKSPYARDTAKHALFLKKVLHSTFYCGIWNNMNKSNSFEYSDTWTDESYTPEWAQDFVTPSFDDEYISAYAGVVSRPATRTVVDRDTAIRQYNDILATTPF